MNFDDIVSSYIRNYRRDARAEMLYFEKERSFLTVIEKAALCKTPLGKRHPHQTRIPKAVLQEAQRRLLGIKRKLARSGDFAALHGLLEAEIGSLHGVGPLTVYDIAHRLGAYLRKRPTLVYLHAGTKRGAAVLNLRGSTIRREQLPSAFSKLSASEIEDCLCIYKSDLRKAASKYARQQTGGYKIQQNGNNRAGELCYRSVARRMFRCYQATPSATH